MPPRDPRTDRRATACASSRLPACDVRHMRAHRPPSTWSTQFCGGGFVVEGADLHDEAASRRRRRRVRRARRRVRVAVCVACFGRLRGRASAFWLATAVAACRLAVSLRLLRLARSVPAWPAPWFARASACGFGSRRRHAGDRVIRCARPDRPARRRLACRRRSASLLRGFAARRRAIRNVDGDVVGDGLRMRIEHHRQDDHGGQHQRDRADEPAPRALLFGQAWGRASSRRRRGALGAAGPALRADASDASRARNLEYASRPAGASSFLPNEKSPMYRLVRGLTAVRLSVCCDFR